MNSPEHLMLPGPTPFPESVREAMATPALGHRGGEFKTVLERVLPRLKWIFQTQNDVFLLTASGTAAMEAGMINTLNPDDEVLVFCCGVFSERWAEMAELLGATVTRIQVEPGEANTDESLREALQAKNDYKAVVFTHSETSTSVLNPLKTLCATVRALASPETLIFVDAVTSMGATSVPVDEWDIDVAISGSQKSFMISPGLSFLSVSPRAWRAFEACERPGLYFNFKKYKKAQDAFSTPYTPATHLILALDQALSMMEAEGLAMIFQRHTRLRDMTRAGVKALGLELLVSSDELASPAVTAVRPPSEISVDAIRAGLKKDFGLIVANGQKELKGQIFRIGHLGYQFDREINMTLTALESVLSDLGHPVVLGRAVLAAKQAGLKHEPSEITC